MNIHRKWTIKETISKCKYSKHRQHTHIYGWMDGWMHMHVSGIILNVKLEKMLSLKTR